MEAEDATSTWVQYDLVLNDLAMSFIIQLDDQLVIRTMRYYLI